MSPIDALKQLRYILLELQLQNNTRWWRWVSCWFSATFTTIAAYRIDRAFYLLLGRYWSAIRILPSPLALLLRPWVGRCELHYKADVEGDLRVLHPSLGVVVSKHARIGRNLTLTGGNCIGGRAGMKPGELVIGDNVSLGANAVILGPVRIGNNVTIGAGAVVVNDAEDGVTLVGVPARPVIRRAQQAPESSA